MPFTKPLPHWEAPGIEPPTSLRQNGWKAGIKPPDEYFNYLQNKAYEALKELQEYAVHKDEMDLSGVATKEDLKVVKEELTTHSADKADPHNSKQQVIDWAKGFGIGGVAKNITGTNINNLDASGSYMGERLEGAPTVDWYYVDHVKHNDQFAIQKLRLISTQRARTVERRKLGGTWGPFSDALIQDNTRASNMDANNLTTPGFYALGGDTANARHLDWGMLLVFVSGDVVHQVGLSIGNRLSMRTKVGSSMGGDWSRWESYALADTNGYIMPTMLPGPTQLNDKAQSREIPLAEYPGANLWSADVLAFRAHLAGTVRVYWKEYANTSGTITTGSQMLVNGIVRAEYTRNGGALSPLYGLDITVTPGDIISFRLKTSHAYSGFWGRIDEAYIGGNIIRIERTI